MSQLLKGILLLIYIYNRQKTHSEQIHPYFRSYFSRIRTRTDHTTPRCVLNEPIRIYRVSNKMPCLARCARNVDCSGANIWWANGLVCKEIGKSPYIFVAAPYLCTFYQLRNITNEKLHENDTKSSVQKCTGICLPSDIEKCNYRNEPIRSSPNDKCSIPFTYNGQLHHSCTQLFLPNCTYYFCLGVSREILYCLDQTDELKLEEFTQLIEGLTSTVPRMPVKVFNDWLIIQQRLNGDQSFDQGYRMYRAGFGDPSGNYWFGILRMSIVTYYTTFRLRIEVKFMDGRWISDEYGSFWISPEGTNFRLFASRYKGDNGDVLNDLNITGRAFKVKDNLYKMEEEEEGRNCTIDSRSGWWFNNNCSNSANLNAPYSTIELKYFDYATNDFQPVSVVRMMMIPRLI